MNILTREVIGDAERIKVHLHRRMHVMSAIRNQSPKEHKEWEEAADAWHTHEHPVDRLWCEEFMADLRESVPYAVEEAIVYLEADPWYHRSGYLKERLIRGLKTAVLKNSDRVRLWNVCWNVAAGKNRREFRNYCSLAAVVGDADLIELLKGVSEERNIAAKGKFGFMLNYLQHHKKSEQDKMRRQIE
ncbi:MAG: hypothetical protein ACSHX0_05860 [Akkermansiaceae bacterium]